MSEHEEVDWTPAERERLAEAHAGARPSEELEARTLARLRREGLLAQAAVPAPGPSRAVRWLRVAAVLAVGFAAGLLARSSPTTEERQDAPEIEQVAALGRNFLLLLRSERDALRTGDAEEDARRAAEYGAWARGLGPSFRDGAELADESWLLEARDGEPSVLALDEDVRVAGYFIVAASDRERALEIAQDCPHLAYGGQVEVRELMD